MKIVLRMPTITCLLASFYFFSGIALAQEGNPKEMTGDDYDHYWTGKGNPNMSEKAVELTNPKEVYLEKDGYLIMECEESYFNESWELKQEPEGFLGSGYLKYIGEDLQANLGGHETDIHVRFQQNIEDRLIFPIRITSPGTYRARVRVIHHMEDGDNDAWINLMRTPRRATRFGGKNPGEYHWNAFGWDGKQVWDGDFNTFTFTVPGDYLLYIGGRSLGFAVDRVILHQDNRQEQALDEKAKPSKLVPSHKKH